jgi:hypothetical protein
VNFLEIEDLIYAPPLAAIAIREPISKEKEVANRLYVCMQYALDLLDPGIPAHGRSELALALVRSLRGLQIACE